MQKKLIVVKAGTSSLTKDDGSISSEKVKDITAQLWTLKSKGHNVVLISSGAIAAGFGRLGFSKGLQALRINRLLRQSDRDCLWKNTQNASLSTILPVPSCCLPGGILPTGEGITHIPLN